MKKLQELNPFIKILLIILAFTGSIYLMPTSASQLAYILMFTGLFILFEAFGFQLFVKILIALGLGLILALSGFYQGEALAAIRPVGSVIFMNLLTMVLVPLVFASILTGITSLGDIQKLNKIGTRTIIYYILTTAVAITIGLFFANFTQPGSEITSDMRAQFEASQKEKATEEVAKAEKNRQTLFEGL
ncbi:MAG: cation:dicarboxylase symporter family transporter, partial [Calditrichaeota bacterium]|nr:cation:dicarboxylase symporter family transporter [Calditrichota bacterium]